MGQTERLMPECTSPSAILQQKPQFADDSRMAARPTSSWCWLTTLAALVVDAPASRAEDSSPAPRGLDSVKRLIRHINFEEAAEVPLDMPASFYRVLTRDGGPDGFPDFGQMRLDDGAAAEGTWSFRFDLRGGSMAAAIPPAVIPVLAGSDYRVTAMIRTEGLAHARARVVARLLDVRGERIPGAEFMSAALSTSGGWAQAALDIPGEFETAADLTLELQLLQPRHWKGEVASGVPLLEDVAGAACFDDIRVWLVPGIDFSSSAPANMALREAPLDLRIGVRDVSTERLMLDVDIFDARGERVQRSAGMDAPSGSRPLSLPFKPQDAGWYRCVLSVRNQREVIATRSLELVRLEPASSRVEKPQVHFGVDLAELSEPQLRFAPQLLSAMQMRHCTLPVWYTSSAQTGPETDQLRQVCDALLDQRIQPTLLVPDIPRHLAERLRLDPSQTLEFLGLDATAWRPYLEETMLSLGQHLHRWQIGRSTRPAQTWSAERSDLFAHVERAISSLVPGPCVVVPWAAEAAAADPMPGCAATLVFPAGATEEAFIVAGDQWKDHLDRLGALLNVLPADEYTPIDRVTSLALSTVAAWRGGFRSLAISAPWGWTGERHIQPSPSPEFVVWRELAQRLEGRRYVGDLALGEGLRCLIARGDSLSSLIAWSETCPRERAFIHAALSSSSVTVVDLFGNRRTIEPIDGIHTIPLGPMPLFIEGVDAGLAQFRGGFHVQPALIPSLHQVHEHELVLANPFGVTISGTLRLVEPVDWEFMPRTQNFTIPPGETLRMPVRLTFPRGELAGEKRIVADVEFNGERVYAVRLETPIELGLPGVQFQAHWRLAQGVTDGRTDLVVYEQVVNVGKEPLSLEAFAAAPGYHHKRKPIVELPPGQSAVRIFHFPDGVSRLRGQTIRVGVSESQGPGRLNREIVIPP
jgi:hypothetical protein